MEDKVGLYRDNQYNIPSDATPRIIKKLGEMEEAVKSIQAQVEAVVSDIKDLEGAISGEGPTLQNLDFGSF